MMEELRFTKRTLGKYATSMLIRKNVFQSIRSKANKIKVGDTIQITLDGISLYPAKVTDILPVNLGNLIGRDPLDGGFDEIADLQAALKRAGFRFKPLKEYNAVRIRFSPYQVEP